MTTSPLNDNVYVTFLGGAALDICQILARIGAPL